MHPSYLGRDGTAVEPNVATTVKKDVYAVYEDLVIKAIDQLVKIDADQLEQSLRN
ncbi:MAG: hypothetical protein HC879_19295 [Leptolyngbyaceae cyanobacterium SL_5_9]|nr:hypothetical protein [Leptolyngbyaceae cyanobacterium SL_5_9]